MDILEYVLVFTGLAAFAVQAIFAAPNLRRYGILVAFLASFSLLVKALVETSMQDFLAWVFLCLFIGYRFWIVWNETRSGTRVSKRIPAEDR